MDHSSLGYGKEIEATMSEDSDEDDVSITQFCAAPPRNVRRAESLEGPYSLLSLPLPSDAPDSARRGSGHSSPAQSSPGVAARPSRSLDQRLDELFAKGKLGDGISPPSSISDRQSDVEESDSLSEEELDIIKLRKPVTVTLQPGTSSAAHSTMPQSKSSSENKSDDQEVDHVSPMPERATPMPEDNAAPLTDDMVDQIVRMKPMMAKAARKPSSLDAANSSPEDLSLKTHPNVPVDLSSKPCSSEKVTSGFVDPPSLSVSTSCPSAVVSTMVASNFLARSLVPLLTPLSQFRPTDPRCRPSTVAESQSSSSSDNVQTQTEATEQRTESVVTIMSPSVILPVPSVSSSQQCLTIPSTGGSTVLRSADGTSSCQKRASDQPIGKPVSDCLLSTTSRYCGILSFCPNVLVFFALQMASQLFEKAVICYWLDPQKVQYSYNRFQKFYFPSCVILCCFCVTCCTHMVFVVHMLFYLCESLPCYFASGTDPNSTCPDSLLRLYKSLTYLLTYLLYSTCSCSFYCCVNILQKKVFGSVFSSRIGDEIWQNCSSSKYALTDKSQISDVMSYFQDGGHDVISRKCLKLLHFSPNYTKTWPDCSSSKHASIGAVSF